MNLLTSLFGPPMPALSAAELNDALKGAKRPLVIDVREPDEYRSGHISGAKLFPLGDLNRRLEKLPKDKQIVCVCASGSRSRSATRMLIQAGYDAVDMRGGMFMWQRAGLPVKKGDAA